MREDYLNLVYLAAITIFLSVIQNRASFDLVDVEADSTI
jgi:hypothetical protein